MGVRNKEVDYKDPAFDPNSATVLELRSILGQYGVPMRGRLNKSDLVELFNTQVRPKLQAPPPKAARGAGVPRVHNQAEAEALAEQIREREEAKAAKRGTTDVAGPAAAVVVSPPLDRHQEPAEAAAAPGSRTVDRNFNIFQSGGSSATGTTKKVVRRLGGGTATRHTPAAADTGALRSTVSDEPPSPTPATKLRPTSPAESLVPDSSPPSRHRQTLSPAALNFDDTTPAAHARRVQVVRPLPPSAPLFSWTHVIGVLIVGLLAAYAGHTYRVTRLPYCDNGVVPANAWWPECQPCPGGATCTDGLAKCDDPMKTVQNGQCRENKDLVRRVTKATEAISAALTHDAGSRYCNEVDVPGDEVYVTYSTTQLLKLLQSHGYSIAPKDAVTALKNVEKNRATTVPFHVDKPASGPPTHRTSEGEWSVRATEMAFSPLQRIYCKRDAIAAAREHAPTLAGGATVVLGLIYALKKRRDRRRSQERVRQMTETVRQKLREQAARAHADAALNTPPYLQVDHLRAILIGTDPLPRAVGEWQQVEVEVGKDPRIAAISYVVDGVQAECWEWKAPETLNM